MDAPENTVEAREESMQLQLAGAPGAAPSAEEAAAGLAEAQRELIGHGAGYGLGFGYVKNFGSPGGLDGIRIEYAISDGERVANVHAVISGTRLSVLGYDRAINEPDDELRKWALEELYRQAGSIARRHDRYATLLMRHPLRLG